MGQSGRKAGAGQEEAGINFIVFVGQSLFPTLVSGRLIAEWIPWVIWAGSYKLLQAPLQAWGLEWELKGGQTGGWAPLKCYSAGEAVFKHLFTLVPPPLSLPCPASSSQPQSLHGMCVCGISLCVQAPMLCAYVNSTGLIHMNERMNKETDASVCTRGGMFSAVWKRAICTFSPTQLPSPY